MSKDQQNIGRSNLPTANRLVVAGWSRDTTSLPQGSGPDRERLLQILNEALALLEQSAGSWDRRHDRAPPSSEDSSSDQSDQQP